MIGLLHGYLLEGSGSNLWTRAMAQALCRAGRDIHLFCQEGHPERYDFIARATRYFPDGSKETTLERDTPYPGKAILHKPQIGDTLPVYVGDKYEEFARVVRMPDLTDAEIEEYVELNARVVERLVRENDLRALHANHVVLMPSVAQRVSRRTGVPYAIMPHGSAIEYAVKKDPRLRRLAGEALCDAGAIFAIGPELRNRVCAVFTDVPDLDTRMEELHLGADTSLFAPVQRSERRAAIDRLIESLASLPRGRVPEQTYQLLRILESPPDEATLMPVLERAARYDGKLPDAGLVEQLSRVDWENDPVLLFVGRLIAAKGVTSILAALPLVLDEAPGTRLLLVGHGPLRETAELLVAALAGGDRRWIDFIVARGALLEGPAARPLTEIRSLLDAIERNGHMDRYLTSSRCLAEPGRVVFTGYLTHAELRHLFPCCDVAIFPSVVAEAGPLVFLEALSSGVFPMGTYLAGMGATIDIVSRSVRRDASELMKISPDPTKAARDIARNVPRALAMAERLRDQLRAVALREFDWQNVAQRWTEVLDSIASG